MRLSEVVRAIMVIRNTHIHKRSNPHTSTCYIVHIEVTEITAKGTFIPPFSGMPGLPNFPEKMADVIHTEYQ